MNATRRFFVAGGLLTFLAGCSSHTDSNRIEPELEPAVTQVSARELLDATLAEAQASNRRVLVHVGAPW